MNLVEASIEKIKEERGTPSEYPLFSLVGTFNDNNFLGNSGSEIDKDILILSHERQIRKHIIARIKDRIIKSEFKFKKLNSENTHDKYFLIEGSNETTKKIKPNVKGYKLLENNCEGIRIRSFNNSDPFRVNTDCQKRLSRRV